jgi:general secretion pathway protein K
VREGKVSLPQLEHFRRLLGVLDLAPTLADALADWIDADAEPQPRSGAEDSHYLGLGRAYLVANGPLVDVAELALVRGFDESVRTRLRPYVTALPAATAVNVNTAPAEVLAAIVAGLGIGQARAIAIARDKAYFHSAAEFSSALPAGLVARGEDVTVQSDYFVVKVHARIGEGQARAVALLARDERQWPRVVWRKFL